MGTISMKTPLRLKQVCPGSLVRAPISYTSFKRIAVIGKGRKESGGFIGAEDVMNQLTERPPKRRVGPIVEGAPARRVLCFLSHLYTWRSQSSFRRGEDLHCGWHFPDWSRDFWYPLRH